MKWLVLFCLCALALVAEAEEQQVMLCGRELARARVLLCYGAEYVMFKKRSSNDLSADSPDKSNWVWGGRRDALGARWARHKRGLVDECCLKACTAEVIRTYC